MHEAVLGLPRTRSELRRHRERVLDSRLGIVVLKIVDELFSAHGTLWREATVVEKASHIAVRCRIDIDRERGKWIQSSVFEGVVFDGIVVFRVVYDSGWYVVSELLY